MYQWPSSVCGMSTSAHSAHSIYSVWVLLPPTSLLLLLLGFNGGDAIWGGETSQLWAERWAGSIKTEEAWIHLSDRPRMSLLIAPSSDAASSSNWQNVGVDGIKMAAVLFTSMTAACQLQGRLSEHGRERQREWEGRERERERDREALRWRRCRVLFCF